MTQRFPNSRPTPTPAGSGLARRGFTLIELLIVMSILVVLLLVALPVFNYVTGARSTESGVNLAAAMLGRARALALSRPDNKYVGVLFYTDDQNRDAMQIVQVEADDPTNELERYFSYETIAGPSSPTYRKESTVLPNVHPADVVYSQSIDHLTGTASSPFMDRPVVKRYVALEDNGPPPAKPPDSTGTGTATVFVDTYWDTRQTGNTTPVALDAEVQYLPRNVRARVVIRTASGLGNPVNRPGIVLFDKQGRLTRRSWGIARDTDPSVDGGEKLLENMGLTSDLPINANRVSGVALAVYNEADLTNNAIDPKIDNDVNTWVATYADQYTIGQQSGELITAGK